MQTMIAADAYEIANMILFFLTRASKARTRNQMLNIDTSRPTSWVLALNKITFVISEVFEVYTLVCFCIYHNQATFGANQKEIKAILKEIVKNRNI